MEEETTPTSQPRNNKQHKPERELSSMDSSSQDLLERETERQQLLTQAHSYLATTQQTSIESSSIQPTEREGRTSHKVQLLHLPPEILVMVGEWVVEMDWKSVTALSQTCKRWYSVCLQPSVWVRWILRGQKLLPQHIRWNKLLCAAALRGHKELVEYCVARGANNWNRATAGAARGGHKELVEYFVEKGANDWNEAMAWAAFGGHKELVEYLVERGANDWNRAMAEAAFGGHKELVEYFVEKGDNNWNEVMAWAARGGHKELVKYFVEKVAIY